MTFTPGVPAAAPLPPKWLTLSAVGVFLVAVLAILGGLSSLFALLLDRFHPLAGMSGVPPEMVKMMELQKKFVSGPAPALSIGVGVVAIAVGAWAIGRALGVLGAKPKVRRGFRRAVVALGYVELASLALGVWMQIKSYQLYSEFAETFFGKYSSGGHGVDETMKTFMQGGVFVGIAFSIGIGLVKLGFLAWSYYYAGSPEVVAHLERRNAK